MTRFNSRVRSANLSAGSRPRATRAASSAQASMPQCIWGRPLPRIFWLRRKGPRRKMETGACRTPSRSWYRTSTNGTLSATERSPTRPDPFAIYTLCWRTARGETPIWSTYRCSNSRILARRSSAGLRKPKARSHSLVPSRHGARVLTERRNRLRRILRCSRPKPTKTAAGIHRLAPTSFHLRRSMRALGPRRTPLSRLATTTIRQAPTTAQAMARRTSSH